MKLNRDKRPRAWYALRRSLPSWSFEENLRELVRWLPRYGVDELIAIIDGEEFAHGHPSLKWAKRYQGNLVRLRDEMEKLGIRYSLNPWVTLGHVDRGRDARKDLPGLKTMVGHDGSRCTSSACPLSAIWREHVAALWTLYARTAPHVIWIEDDVRTFNHLPVEFGCFCPEHLKRFSARVGKTVTRDEVVEAMLRPGKPHPWRKQYLDVQAEIMIETAGFLAGTVHAVSADTCLGLMSSGPRIHCLEGRRWRRFAEALADGKPLYSRPPLYNYSEASLRGLYCTHDSIKMTRHCMPPGTIEQTEVENVPFTQYADSAAFTFLKMAVSLAYGSHGVTLNLFDHCGTPMQREPVFGRLLREKKPLLEGLARRAQQPGVYRGVRLLHHDEAGTCKRLGANASYRELVADGDPMAEMLESHGIATTYEDAPVVAACGQTLWAFDDEAVGKMLSGGILLDAVAAGVLYRRGFGDLIGLRAIAEPKCIDRLGAFGAEEFFHRKFGGAKRKYMTLTMPDLAGRPDFSLLTPRRGAQIISRVVDPDARRGHVCMYAYENRRGGRVVVHAIDLASAYGPAFNSRSRTEQLQASVRWLARGRVPLLVRGGAYPLCFRKDCGGRTLLGLFNLTLDPWPNVEFELADRREVVRVERLSPSGRWIIDKQLAVKRTTRRIVVRSHRPTAYDDPLFLTVHWRRTHSSA